MSTQSFKHSGDLGDIIFALPTVRALGGGVLYLDPDGGASDPIFQGPDRIDKRTKLTAGRIESLKPLLMQQPYIEDVRFWRGEKVDYNLDRFRESKSWYCLIDMCLDTFHVDRKHKDTAWLTVADPITEPGYPFVINRTVRYHGNYSFWKSNLPFFGPQSLFVGLAKEHEIFEYTFETKVRYQPTPTILQLARYVAGCCQFIGNASFPHAIAEGLKKPLIAEEYRVLCTIHVDRPDAQYV